MRAFHNRDRALFILMANAVLASCGRADLPARSDIVCSPSFYRMIEYRVGVEDDEGHGPDPGSTEWRHAVEHKLAVRDAPGFPGVQTEAWCQHVYDLVRTR